MGFTMEAALAEVRAAAQSDADDQPFQAAAAGEALERALADPETLIAESRRLIEVAARLGCERLMGASPLGERLAGAMVALSANGLKDVSAGIEGLSVLVVDGILVTGVQLASASHRARSAGARSVAGAVVAAAHPSPDQLNATIDSLVVLEH